MKVKNIETISKQIKYSEHRKYGIDLLRILSMVFVVGLHFNQNCCFEKITEFNLNYMWVWISEAIYYTSVDIFILITGFLRGGINQLSIIRRVGVDYMELYFQFGFTPLLF